jgi:hypothetical protein
MAEDTNFQKILIDIQGHIKEEFLDMTDPGDLPDKELIELDNSMGELARAVMHMLGIQVVSIDSSNEFTVKVKLQSTETLEI